MYVGVGCMMNLNCELVGYTQLLQNVKQLCYLKLKHILQAAQLCSPVIKATGLVIFEPHRIDVP